MTKIVMHGPEARDKVIKGANFLADAVKRTLGPFGANALIEKGERITNDGVTIAKEIALKDPIEHRGARKMQEIASKTNDEVGDGTTTSITIGQAIFARITVFLEKKDVMGRKTVADIQASIEKERAEITEKLVAMASKITTEEQLIDVARVAVENDELGAIIGKAQFELGPDGQIIAEETAERTSSVERLYGIRIDNGTGTSLVLNNPEKQLLELENVHVVFTNHTLRDLNALKGVFDILNKTGIRDVVIIARAFTNEAIQIAMANHKQGFRIYPMNAPYVDQVQIMGDMAAVLGGRFINQEESDLGSIQMSDVGFATKIRAGMYSAILTGKDDEQSQERVAKRVGNLQKKLDGEVSDFEKRNLGTRIAQLTNGFALLKVGATSETSRKYLKDKVDDAVNAVRAALQEGVVPGAGQALRDIAEDMPDDSMLKTAIQAPYQQIMHRAPADYAVPEWVKDPVKVIRVALLNACSVASILASVEIVIATEPIKPKYVQEVDEESQEVN